jgi:RNA polymerase sigma-70 factor (ECF subfamily)
MDETEKEASLLRRFREGDAEAWRMLFERYAASLGKRVRGRLPHALLRRTGVSDVLQETQMAAFDARGQFVGETLEGFRRWLFGIAEHKAMDAVRRHQVAEERSIRREVTDVDGEAVDSLIAPDATASEIAMAGELSDFASRARDSLPADHREVLRLTREDGLTIEEAAGRMGRSREAAKKLYGRAVLNFKRAFDRLKGDSGAEA